MVIIPCVKSILNNFENFQPQRSSQDFHLKLQISNFWTLILSWCMINTYCPSNIGSKKLSNTENNQSSITFSSTLKRLFDCNSCHTYFRRSFNFEKTGEVFANVFRSFLKSYPKIIRRPRGWLITDSMNVLHSLELSDLIGKQSISIRNICNKENVSIIVTRLTGLITIGWGKPYYVKWKISFFGLSGTT